VGQRDEVAAGDLARQLAEVLRRQLQGPQQLHDGDLVQRVLGVGMVVDGQLLEQDAAGLDVAVPVDQGLHRQLLGRLGLVLDDLPGLAIERREGPGGVPVERGQDGPDAGRPARRQDREQAAGRDPADDARDDPAVLIQPERPEADVRQERAEEQQQQHPRPPLAQEDPKVRAPGGEGVSEGRHRDLGKKPSTNGELETTPKRAVETSPLLPSWEKVPRRGG